MLREKCLSAVLFLALASSTWAADDFESNSDIKRSGSALSTIGQGIGTMAEGLAHVILFSASLAPYQNDDGIVKWSGELMQSFPVIGDVFKRKSYIFDKNIMLSQILRLLPVANDYACGMLTVTLEDGWYVDNVVVNQGSIQNDHQYEHIGDNIFVPKNRGLTNLLLIKQVTGWTTAANSYILENPIDIYLTVSDGREVSTLNVQKKACTFWGYGAAKVSTVRGTEVNACVTNVSTDKKVSTITAITSAYGKPAQLRIPGEACESL